MTHPHERALEAAATSLRVTLYNESFVEHIVRGKYVAVDRAISAAARAAVTAYIAALQETHALVPREATEAMMLASRRVEPSTHWRDNIRRAWSAMIDAAPPAAQEPRP